MQERQKSTPWKISSSHGQHRKQKRHIHEHTCKNLQKHIEKVHKTPYLQLFTNNIYSNILKKHMVLPYFCNPPAFSSSFNRNGSRNRVAASFWTSSLAATWATPPKAWWPVTFRGSDRWVWVESNSWVVFLGDEKAYLKGF